MNILTLKHGYACNALFLTMFCKWHKETLLIQEFSICDPPRDFREHTGMRAMTWHAKGVIMTRICSYLRSKTKSVMVGFVCSDGVSNVTLKVQLFRMHAIGCACKIARMQKGM